MFTSFQDTNGVPVSVLQQCDRVRDPEGGDGTQPHYRVDQAVPTAGSDPLCRLVPAVVCAGVPGVWRHGVLGHHQGRQHSWVYILCLLTLCTQVKGYSQSSLGPAHSHLPANLRKLYERVWDEADYVVPPAENGAFFITTNVVITPNQTLGTCPEVNMQYF